MIGMILASHGDFAKGIFQSGGMIFGEQEKVQVVTLEPSAGPDSFRAELEKAIATFDKEDEILFLVDLWGGTPFNQANTLLDGNEDKYAIVTGLNLPMLLEAYGARMSMETSHEVASHILAAGRDGVKVKPETLDVAPKQDIPPTAQATEIPVGTVIGDGKIKYVLTRIDSRLLHGQVATAWTKSVNPDRIIVVSDAVSKDALRKELIEQAAPPGVKAHVIPLQKMIDISKDPRFGGMKALLLFENPEDVVTVVDGGVDIEVINVGSMAHSAGKVMVNKTISVDQEDVDAFKHLQEKGIKFDVRKVPNDSSQDLFKLLKEAKGLTV